MPRRLTIALPLDQDAAGRLIAEVVLVANPDHHAPAPVPPTERAPIPRIDDIHRKVYAAASKPAALAMDCFHTCETTHCRAGWVIHLAGEAGYALEKRFNSELAAMLIYRESGYKINPCRFYDSNDAALEDMRRLAEVSA